MMKDKLLNKLLQNRPQLLERYSSEQYELSKQILFWKHKHALTNSEMTELLDMPLHTYLKYEGGYTEYTVEQYNEVLIKLLLHDHKKELSNANSKLFIHSKNTIVKVFHSSSDYRESGFSDIIKKNESKEKGKRLTSDSAFHFSNDEHVVRANYPYQLLDVMQVNSREVEESEFVYQ